jgi:hypothetical protein
MQGKEGRTTGIQGFHSNVNTEGDLGYCTVYHFGYTPKFRKDIMLPSSGQQSPSALKMITTYNRKFFNLVAGTGQELHQY